MAGTSFGVLITGDSRGAVKAIDLTSKQIKDLEGVTEKATRKIKTDTTTAADGFSSMAKSAAKMGAAVGAAGVALGSLVLREVIRNTSEQEKVMAQLNATLKSTGGVAGKTATELAATASSLQKLTTYSDEAIVSAQSLLLTFKNVRGDNFDRTTRAILDMSTALGTDLKSSALQLGKALENPTRGISALTRSGVSFSQAQKDVIKGLAETGRLAEAQTLILAELETQFGGSAEAARNTMGGALAALQNSWGDLFEVQQSASQGMTDSVNALNATISDPAFKAAMDTVIHGLIDVVNWATKGAAAIVWMFQTMAGSQNQGLVDLSDRIDEVTKSLASMEKQGRGGGLAAQKQRAVLKDLQKQYSDLESSIIKASKPVEQLSPILVTAEQRTVKLAAANVSLAKSCDTVKASVDDLSPIIVTATRKTVDFGKTSEEAINSASSSWGDFRTTLSGMFFEIAAQGADFLSTLTNGFKAAVVKMASDAAANTIMLSFGVGASGTASASAGGSLASMGSSLMSTASGLTSASKWGSAIGSGFQTLGGAYGSVAGWGAGLANGGGTFAGLGNSVASGAANQAAIYNAGGWGAAGNLAATAGAGMVGAYAGQQVFQNKGSTGIGATAGTLVGSIWGPIGAGIGAFVGEGIEKAFSSAFGYSGQKKNRASIGFDTATDYASPLGGKHDKDNLRNANDLFGVINEMADMLGGNLSGTIRVSNRDGVEISGLGKFKSSADAFNAVLKELIKSSDTIAESMKPLILGFKGTAEEVSRFAVAVSSINTMAGINTVTNAIKDFATVLPNATESYKTHTDALQEQIRAFDGSLAAAESLNVVLQENKTAAYQFAMSIQSIGRSISDMALGQAASIRESVLTPQQLLNRRYDQRDSLAASLFTEKDPERAAATAQKLLEVNQQIFNSITDDQQLLFAENFAKVAEDTNNVAQYILDQSLKGLQTTQDAINKQVADMLNSAAAKQQTAADTQLQAAQMNLEAARYRGGQVAV
jgi:hypothetical protein